ncbi:PLP-dependent aminotransferase family protein [Enterococcus saccharolyticus]|uniref:HTH gntR-type domain-containing protein n=2 Tax=Enterococcus saccharolyticus TaxID=41997 RepID=S0J923_9ENTE|nr:PLP-dependent aminotransferase family protein [Enterococcus saccharolyticus]EOT29379.1 hypothetical protein OMQ_01331 [Enterococcus saccharolyticus subsp. saccharolyticus ATCC 43076]EOT81177.1 hypothetical protein I572_01709 [Enterococcus saccharolyticus subsp. saccharolyticus ATCC 43076]OJG88496.1 hypothetical protein RV16_GL000238 [Enterococcus saccharolyticus]
MLYKEIEGILANKIGTRTWSSGDKISSIRQLSNEFNCSKNTIIKALSELEKQHLIYSVPKQGFFVATSSAAATPTDCMIDFLSAEPDNATVQMTNLHHCAEQVLSKSPDYFLSYGNQSGLERLKEQLIPYLQDNQVFTSPERLVITTGSQQAIDILMNMPFPNKREKILVEQPTYFGALNSAKISGKDILGITIADEQIDLNRLEYIFKNNEIKLFYIIPRFHNPLGHSYTNELKQAIVALADKYDVYIVEDDYLGDLEQNAKADPMFSYNPTGRVIYLKSFSKIFLPGLRLAVTVLPQSLMPTFLEYKFCRDFSTPLFSQEILATFIENGMFEKHLKSLKDIYALKMHQAKKSCQKYLPANVTYSIPNTGFYFSLQLPENVHSQELTATLKLKNILVDDISRMFLPHISNKNMIRLSISRTQLTDIDYGIAQIAQTIVSLQQKKSSIFKDSQLYI